MANNKFGLGSIGTVVKEYNHLPGSFQDMSIPALVVPAFKAEHTLEFGEIVLLDGDGEKGYKVKGLTSTSGHQTATPSGLAVIVRDRVGSWQRKGVITDAQDNVTISAYLLSETNRQNIAVVLKEKADSPTPVTIGGAVYVGSGGENTMAGVVYADAIKNVADNAWTSFPLTGYEFKSKAFKPTTSDTQVVFIGRK